MEFVVGVNSGSIGATGDAAINASDKSTAELSVADNNEYRYGTLTSLSISMEVPVDDWAAWIVFTSGDTATEMSYPAYIKWSGDGVLDGIFAPVTNTRYNIGLWYDGYNVNAVARGVDV